MRTKLMTAALATLVLAATAACGGDDDGGGESAASTGPIKVWLSNNPDEIAWGKAMVKAWNADHPGHVPILNGLRQCVASELRQIGDLSAATQRS